MIQELLATCVIYLLYVQHKEQSIEVITRVSLLINISVAVVTYWHYSYTIIMIIVYS